VKSIIASPYWAIRAVAVVAVFNILPMAIADMGEEPDAAAARVVVTSPEVMLAAPAAPASEPDAAAAEPAATAVEAVAVEAAPEAADDAGAEAASVLIVSGATAPAREPTAEETGVADERAVSPGAVMIQSAAAPAGVPKENEPVAADAAAESEPEPANVPEKPAVAVAETTEPEPEPERVTLNFAEGADLRDVLTAYSVQSGKSVVLGPEVAGEVRLHLRDVPWNEALDVILQPYGFAYKMVGETIVVSEMEQRSVVEAVEPLISKVFVLRYMDAFGVKEMVESQLTPRGSMSTLTVRGQKGWSYGSEDKGSADSGKREREEETEEEREGDRLRSRTIVVTDIPSVIERVASLLDEVDTMPVQVLIEARFIEVNNGVLRDIGVQFGSGQGGATSAGAQPVTTATGSSVYGLGVQQTGGGAAPSAFQPNSQELNNTQPFNAGLSLLFQKLDPLQFEMLLHALEEDSSLNVLSSPRILTLNNEEATIMVGTKYPIIKTEVSGESGSISTTIDYWQDIGIQLNVVPQMCEDDSIRMVIHPAVTSQIGTASGRTMSGNSVIPFTDYPILSTRETETQVILQNKQTLAIGGLLKNEAQETVFKVPLLGDIPLLGFLFRRKTTTVRQLDLVIFLTATVVAPEESVLLSSDSDIGETSADRERTREALTTAVEPQMSADLRALVDLEKMRRSGRQLDAGAARLSKSEQARRWAEEEKLREELIIRLQTQREQREENGEE
jgi:type IV pilus secretin PilQ/predicted competence protein